MLQVVMYYWCVITTSADQMLNFDQLIAIYVIRLYSLDEVSTLYNGYHMTISDHVVIMA